MSSLSTLLFAHVLEAFETVQNLGPEVGVRQPAVAKVAHVADRLLDGLEQGGLLIFQLPQLRLDVAGGVFQHGQYRQEIVGFGPRRVGGGSE